MPASHGSAESHKAQHRGRVGTGRGAPRGLCSSGHRAGFLSHADTSLRSPLVTSDGQNLLDTSARSRQGAARGCPRRAAPWVVCAQLCSWAPAGTTLPTPPPHQAWLLLLSPILKQQNIGSWLSSSPGGLGTPDPNTPHVRAVSVIVPLSLTPQHKENRSSGWSQHAASLARAGRALIASLVLPEHGRAIIAG